MFSNAHTLLVCSEITDKNLVLILKYVNFCAGVKFCSLVVWEMQCQNTSEHITKDSLVWLVGYTNDYTTWYTQPVIICLFVCMFVCEVDNYYLPVSVDIICHTKNFWLSILYCACNLWLEAIVFLESRLPEVLPITLYCLEQKLTFFCHFNYEMLYRFLHCTSEININKVTHLKKSV